jgi:hypothetical protein
MRLNRALRLADIVDGTSNSLLLAEVRVGLSAQDRRGTWAMGVPGASMLMWHGTRGDDNGPNPCNEDSDDIEGCPNDDASREQRTMECMTCFFAGDSVQAAPRSRHPLGVLVATADASVHFVSDSIDRGFGPWSPGFSVWDRFCTPADGNALDVTRVFTQ